MGHSHVRSQLAHKATTERPCAGTPAAGPAELPTASQHKAPAWPCSRTRSPDGHGPTGSDHRAQETPSKKCGATPLPFSCSRPQRLCRVNGGFQLRASGSLGRARAARTINDTTIWFPICKCPGWFGDPLWRKSSQSRGSHELVLQLLCPFVLTSAAAELLLYTSPGSSSNLAERDIREEAWMTLTWFAFSASSC